jgi:Family of unknown function (DUF6193)
MWLVVGVDEEHRFPEWGEAVDCYRAMVRGWTGAHGDPTGVTTEVAELPTGGSHHAVFADPEGGRPVTFSIGWEAGSTAAENDAEDHSPEMFTLYPDVAAIGDASRAWQAEFDRLGIPLRVHQRADWNTASVSDRERWAVMSLSLRERQLRLYLHVGQNVWPAKLEGIAPDLAAAAVAAQLFLSGARLGEIAAVCPFLGSVALAEAMERGDEREHSWLELYENPAANLWVTRLAPFIALAFHEPSLRALRPFGSHGTLYFSRTPTWPFTWDHPWVCRFEQYHMTDGQQFPDGYVVDDDSRRTFIAADAPAALARVLAELRD